MGVSKVWGASDRSCSLVCVAFRDGTAGAAKGAEASSFRNLAARSLERALSEFWNVVVKVPALTPDARERRFEAVETSTELGSGGADEEAGTTPLWETSGSFAAVMYCTSCLAQRKHTK